MKLSELNIGDRFTQWSKPNVVFKVVGKSEYNQGHGSATRKCVNESTGDLANKSCRSDVRLINPLV